MTHFNRVVVCSISIMCQGMFDLKKMKKLAKGDTIFSGANGEIEFFAVDAERDWVLENLAKQEAKQAEIIAKESHDYWERLTEIYNDHADKFVEEFGIYFCEENAIESWKPPVECKSTTITWCRKFKEYMERISNFKGVRMSLFFKGSGMFGGDFQEMWVDSADVAALMKENGVICEQTSQEEKNKEIELVFRGGSWAVDLNIEQITTFKNKFYEFVTTGASDDAMNGGCKLTYLKLKEQEKNKLPKIVAKLKAVFQILGCEERIHRAASQE